MLHKERLEAEITALQAKIQELTIALQRLDGALQFAQFLLTAQEKEEPTVVVEAAHE